MPHPVEAALREQVDAWNRGDLEGYLAVCAPDIVYVHAGGVVRGRDALRARYGAARGQLTVQVLDMAPGADQVTLTAAWQVDGHGGHALLVWRRDDRWLLAWDATIGAVG